MLTNETMRAAVEAGCIELDRENPGWHRRVNLEKLNMSSPQYCVLGQVYGRFSNGLDKLEIGLGAPYGFAIPAKHLGTCARLEWDRLGKIWAEEIDARNLTDELEAATDFGLRDESELDRLGVLGVASRA